MMGGGGPPMMGGGGGRGGGPFSQWGGGIPMSDIDAVMCADGIAGDPMCGGPSQPQMPWSNVPPQMMGGGPPQGPPMMGGGPRGGGPPGPMGGRGMPPWMRGGGRGPPGGGPPQQQGPPGGGGVGGGSGGITDCGRPSINWYNGKILDTGNPMAYQAPSAPGAFNQMAPIYASNNVVFDKGAAWVEAATNNVGSGKRVGIIRCDSQWQGFGFFDVDTGHTVHWGERGHPYNFHLYHPTIARARRRHARHHGFYQMFPGGGGGGGGACDGGDRIIKGYYNSGGGWQQFRACIDSGTPNVMPGDIRGGGSMQIQLKFDPNPNPITMPVKWNAPQGQGMPFSYVPSYYMSKLVKMELTRDFIVVTSQADAKQILTYSCNGGVSNGDTRHASGMQTPLLRVPPKRPARPQRRHGYYDVPF